MIRRSAIVMILGATAFGGGCASTGDSSAAAAVPTDPAFAPVAWLEGAWSRTDPRGRRTEEYWTPPRAGTMFGTNRVIAGGRTVFFENLCIEAQEDGTLVYLASPKGRQPPTPFRMISATADEVVFENPEHDFPQRVIYRRTSETDLTMRIEGMERGERQFSEWPMRREEG